MYHLLPIHVFCTNIYHYPEFCCVATTFEYRVMRQVKYFLAVISIIPKYQVHMSKFFIFFVKYV